MRTRRTEGTVDSTSKAVFEAEGSRFEVSLSGRADLLGETCSACPVSLHLSVTGSPAAGDSTIDDVHLSAGTGTAPIIPMDADGVGIVPPGVLNGTLSMRVLEAVLAPPLGWETFGRRLGTAWAYGRFDPRSRERGRLIAIPVPMWTAAQTPIVRAVCA